jgi:hypothetical protein
MPKGVASISPQAGEGRPSVLVSRGRDRRGGKMKDKWASEGGSKWEQGMEGGWM